ncbi:Swi5-domain-containing protein [Colletotrichum acutatum]|uniref:Swi5-domain-containing protein n=1 Tax=Glomerella acutata TaxID=27357 RepID=A0AAD8XIX2_GLOAC|nr:Swi5-domain-containing protein [Colletotrichum acutatum]KAK1725175.1 Swi5-domain-containing protein [Colletotrichum acutatum]
MNESEFSESGDLREAQKIMPRDIETEMTQNIEDSTNSHSNPINKDVQKDEEFEEASAVVAKHVKLLREYNQIKDVGQQLMGMVAEKRGVTVGSLYETREFGVEPKD